VVLRRLGNTTRAAISPVGDAVVTVGDDVRRSDLRGTSTPHDWVLRPSWRVVDLAFSAGVELLVTVGTEPQRHLGHIEIWDASSGTVTSTFTVAGRPHRLACSTNGELAAFLTNGHLSVWHLPTQTAVTERTGEAHGGWLSVAFDPHGRRIVTGGIDGTVGVWDATSGGPPFKTFQWGVGPVYAVAFDCDGLRAAAVGHSGAIVWDVDE
jgi:WD40 repeat protein